MRQPFRPLHLLPGVALGLSALLSTVGAWSAASSRSAPSVPGASTVGGALRPAPAVPLVIENSASFEPGQVPSGALLTILVPARITQEPDQAFEPWSTTAPDKLRIEADCRAGGAPVSLPLRAVTAYSTGDGGSGTRVDVYYPNSWGDEPWGTCDDAGQAVRVTVYPQGDPTKALAGTVRVVPLHPGLFGVGTGVLGVLVHGTQQVPLSSCTGPAPMDDPCAVRVDGVPGELRLAVTGADVLTGPPGGRTRGAAGVVLSPVRADGSVDEDATHARSAAAAEVTTTSQGRQELRVPLPADLPPGTWRIRAWNSATGLAVQDLRIRFGPDR